MGDYNRLQQTISRLQAGESMEPGQVGREQSEQVASAARDFAQDENVRGCGLIAGVGFVILAILGLIISAVQWVINTVGGLF